jgi:hypothetical protein
LNRLKGEKEPVVSIEGKVLRKQLLQRSDENKNKNKYKMVNKQNV